MIPKDEVKHIAKLARLELSEKEIIKMQKDLSEILEYFNLLMNVPEIKAGKKLAAKNQNLRQDETKRSDLADEIIAAAPDKKDDYIKVKAIF